MFSRLATFVVLAWSALYASAAISIVAPSTDFWWVANSQNLYSWTCGTQFNEGYTNFTVLISNQNPSFFNGPLALVSIQWDYDCSVLLPSVTSLPVGTGYLMQFADVFNQTHIIATSSPFEVKAQGSAYAPQPSGAASATVTATLTGSAASTASASTTAKSGAESLSQPAAYGLVGTLFALVAAGIML